MREEDEGDAFGMGGYEQFNPSNPYDPNPPNVGRVEGARCSVQRVHEEMRDVESVLIEMERENAENETKLLAQRHLVFEKYFMVTGHLVLQGVVGEWKAYVQQAKHDAEADGLTLQQHQANARRESHLVALEGEAKALRQLCQQTRAETELQVAPLRAAREEANLRAEQLEAVITSMGEVAARVTALADQARPGAAQPPSLAGKNPAQLTELAKNTIQGILRDIDPNYRPPVVVSTGVVSPKISPVQIATSPGPLPNATTTTTVFAAPPITTVTAMPMPSANPIGTSTTTIRPMGGTTTTTVLPQMRTGGAIYSVAREPRL